MADFETCQFYSFNLIISIVIWHFIKHHFKKSRYTFLIALPIYVIVNCQKVFVLDGVIFRLTPSYPLQRKILS